MCTYTSPTFLPSRIPAAGSPLVSHSPPFQAHFLISPAPPLSTPAPILGGQAHLRVPSTTHTHTHTHTLRRGCLYPLPRNLGQNWGLASPPAKQGERWHLSHSLGTSSGASPQVFRYKFTRLSDQRGEAASPRLGRDMGQAALPRNPLPQPRKVKQGEVVHSLQDVRAGRPGAAPLLCTEVRKEARRRKGTCPRSHSENPGPLMPGPGFFRDRA